MTLTCAACLLAWERLSDEDKHLGYTLHPAEVIWKGTGLCHQCFVTEHARAVRRQQGKVSAGAAAPPPR